MYNITNLKHYSEVIHLFQLMPKATNLPDNLLQDNVVVSCSENPVGGFGLFMVGRSREWVYASENIKEKHLLKLR